MAFANKSKYIEYLNQCIVRMLRESRLPVFGYPFTADEEIIGSWNISISQILDDYSRLRVAVKDRMNYSGRSIYAFFNEMSVRNSNSLNSCFF